MPLTNELIGENGWVWNMRLLMLGLGGPDAATDAAKKNPMFSQYGYDEASHAQARDTALDILRHFAQHTIEQSKTSAYLIGQQLSALDIYWAYFSQILSTLPSEQCPMPKGLRYAYDSSGEALSEKFPELLAQRDYILSHHLTLPMTF